MALVKPISGVDDRISLVDSLPLSSPFTLNVFPTNACNFKCSYCAHSLETDKLIQIYGIDKGFMSMDTMSVIVEQSKKFKPYKLLSFMGHGEPLLDRSLPEKIELAAKAGIADRIEIITNASMLTKELTDELVKSGLTNLRVSLQGLDSISYYENCKYKINFDELLEQLAYFNKTKKKDMGLYIKILDSALPPSDEKTFYDLFDKICDRMYIEKIQPVYHAVNIDNDENIDNSVTDRYGNKHEKRIVCPLAFFTLSVWPDGDVQPCDAIYKPRLLGNVHKSTLYGMWNSDTLKAFRLEHLSRNKNKLRGCADCCAPDDVSHSKDVLDGHEEILIEKFTKSIIESL